MNVTSGRVAELAATLTAYLAADPATRMPLRRYDLEDIAEVLRTGDPMGLTPMAVSCMQIIQEMTDERGYAPTYDEVRHELGLGSKSGVFRLFNQLQERGYIERIPFRSRAIRIVRRVPMPDFSDARFRTSPAPVEGGA